MKQILLFTHDSNDEFCDKMGFKSDAVKEREREKENFYAIWHQIYFLFLSESFFQF